VSIRHEAITDINLYDTQHRTFATITAGTMFIFSTYACNYLRLSFIGAGARG